MVTWAKKREILLLNDNPYSEIVFPSDRRLSLLQAPGAMDICVEFNSLSKSYNMTGWRIGMAVGGKEIIGAMSRFKENVTSGVFNAIQLASIKAMDAGDLDIENMLAIYRRRRETVFRAFADMGLSVKAGEGTFYLWIPAPDGLSSMDFATKLLQDSGVLVTPGTAYGEHGEGYIRVALTIPDSRLEQALERIRKTVEKGW